MLALSAQGRPAALLVTMHFARTRKRLTAWLGLVAMVLVLFVPMVSQALEAQALQAFEQAAPLCEAKPSAAASTALPIGHEMPAGHHHAACGYCDLLADQVLVPTTLRRWWSRHPSMPRHGPRNPVVWLRIRRAIPGGRATHPSSSDHVKPGQRLHRALAPGSSRFQTRRRATHLLLIRARTYLSA